MKKIILCSVMFFLCYLVNAQEMNNNKIDIAKDTLMINDSIKQILTYKDGKLIEVYLINYKNKFGNFVQEQLITFHENGVISKIEMTNAVNIISGYYAYRENNIYMTDKGMLERAVFTGEKGFLVEYPRGYWGGKKHPKK